MEAFSLSRDIGIFSHQNFLTEYDVYRTLLNIAVKQTQSEGGYFHLYDEEHDEIHLAVWSDAVMARCTTNEESHQSLGKAGFWADCIRQRKTVVHNDVWQHSPSPTLPEGHISFNHHMSTPVFHDNGIVAVIGLGRADGAYEEIHVSVLEEVAENGWPVVSAKIAERNARKEANHRKFSEKPARESLAEMIVAIGKATELRDEYTSRHQENVAYICGLIGAQLRLTTEEQFGLFLGASVHDIGKIAIPSQILNKTGKFVPAELNLIKLHAEYGANIFENVELPWPIKKMILQHHERQDGSGYPKSLKGDDICLEARIIAVADTFDAMSADRPYRKAPGKMAAIDALKSGRGVLYDPYVVDAFMVCMNRDPVLNSDKYV